MHHTHQTTLLALARARVAIGTFLDCGAATGYLSTELALHGLFPGAKMFNIDANPRFEPAYRRIAEATGGGYAIAALAAAASNARMTFAQDEDWMSLRDAADPYWSRFHAANRHDVETRTRTLDEIVETAALPPPYALKLDVQGYEVEALRGAARTLALTEFAIVEIDVAGFGAIDALLKGAGLELFDLSDLSHGADGRLLEFYATYLRAPARHGFAETWVPPDKQDELAARVAGRRATLANAVEANLAKLTRR